MSLKINFWLIKNNSCKKNAKKKDEHKNTRYLIFASTEFILDPTQGADVGWMQNVTINSYSLLNSKKFLHVHSDTSNINDTIAKLKTHLFPHKKYI